MRQVMLTRARTRGWAVIGADSPATMSHEMTGLIAEMPRSPGFTATGVTVCG